MKLHFEPNLDFQLQAIEAVCDLFRGQEICRTEFTVTREATERQAHLAFDKNELGIGNGGGCAQQALRPLGVDE